MKHLLLVLGLASSGCSASSFGLAPDFDDAEAETTSGADETSSSDAKSDDSASLIDSGTPPPTDTGTPPPIDTGTPPPIDSGTPPPVDSGTPPPADTGPITVPSPYLYTFPDLGDTSTRAENHLSLMGDFVKGSRLVLFGHTKATLTLSYTPPAATRYLNVAFFVDGLRYRDQTFNSADTVAKIFTATFPMKPSGNRVFELRVMICGDVCDPSFGIKIANGTSTLKIE